MAIGACFGGPLLNLLLGIGIGCTIRTLKGRPVPFPLDNQAQPRAFGMPRTCEVARTDARSLRAAEGVRQLPRDEPSLVPAVHGLQQVPIEQALRLLPTGPVRLLHGASYRGGGISPGSRLGCDPGERNRMRLIYSMAASRHRPPHTHTHAAQGAGGACRPTYRTTQPQHCCCG